MPPALIALLLGATGAGAYQIYDHYNRGIWRGKHYDPNRLRLVPGVSWQPGRTAGGRLRIAPTEIFKDIEHLMSMLKGPETNGRQ